MRGSFSARSNRRADRRLAGERLRTLEAFRIVNGYGLFRVMTKDRSEIVIEGSADGIELDSRTNSNGNRAT